MRLAGLSLQAVAIIVVMLVQSALAVSLGVVSLIDLS